MWVLRCYSSCHCRKTLKESNVRSPYSAWCGLIDRHFIGSSSLGLVFEWEPFCVAPVGGIQPTDSEAKGVLPPFQHRKEVHTLRRRYILAVTTVAGTQ